IQFLVAVLRRQPMAESLEKREAQFRRAILRLELHLPAFLGVRVPGPRSKIAAVMEERAVLLNIRAVRHEKLDGRFALGTFVVVTKKVPLGVRRRNVNG